MNVHRHRRARHRDPSMQAPEYVRNIAPLSSRQTDRRARARVRLGRARHREARVERESARPGTGSARGDRRRRSTMLSRYPDGNGFELKAALATRHRVAADQIVLGNGSNDVLELVTQAFLRPGDHAVYSRHAFAVYPLATQARGATGIEVAATPLRPRPAGDARRDHADDAGGLRREPEQPDRHVVRRRPRSRRFSHRRGRRRARRARRGVSTNTSSPRSRRASAAWIGRYPNLVVSRTFSKAYGLAALRVGYGIMHREGRRHAEPRPAAVQRQRACAGGGGRRARRHRVRRGKPAPQPRGHARARRGLSPRSDSRSLPSHANFMLVQVGDAGRVYQRLLAQGVIVRPVANYALPEWLRVTVGVARGESPLPRCARGARLPDDSSARVPLVHDDRARIGSTSSSSSASGLIGGSFALAQKAAGWRARSSASAAAA